MKKIDEGLMREYLDREAKRGLTGPKWEKYLRSKVAWLLKLTDGTIFGIEKPTIETHFCFGESGYDIDEKLAEAAEARTNANLFRIRNLRDLDEKIKALKEGPDEGYEVWASVFGGVAIGIYVGRWWNKENTVNPIDLSDEDKKRIAEGYEIVRDGFAKRIDAYLKRYGLSKVHSWTYWVDA